MKVNEVEQLLKISAKALRFYEERGLIVVSRDQSGYRNYSKENIEVLKEIKLYREMGVSLADIKDHFEGKEDITLAINKQIETIQQLEERKSIYQAYIKEYKKGKKDVDACFNALEFLHSEEYEELNYRTLGGQIIMTLCLGGPVLFSFFLMSNISLLHYGLSLIAVILLTISWYSFIKEYEFTKKNIIRDIKTMFKKMLMFIIIITIAILLIMGFQFIQSKFLPDNYMLVQFKYPYIYLPFLLIGEFLIIIGALFNRKREMVDMRYMNDIFAFIKKYYLIAIGVNLFLIYVCISSVIIITDQKIMNYSFYNPLGQEYTFDQVTKVNTGFRGNLFGILRKKGDFFYKMKMEDDTVMIIELPYANSERYQNTYEEYIELDQLIMAHDVEKISSEKNKEHAQLDQRYIDIMLEVIHNKN